MKVTECDGLKGDKVTFECRKVYWKDYKKEREYVFSLRPDYRQYLKAGQVDRNLRIAFENSKLPLSSDAIISIIDEKDWKVIDGDMEYLVKDFGTQLNIYEREEALWKGVSSMDFDLSYEGKMVGSVVCVLDRPMRIKKP